MVARAEAISGLYIGAGVGANFLQNQTIKGVQLPGAPYAFAGSNPKFDTGLATLGSVGWGFGNGLRVELEGNYRFNNLRSVGGIPGSPTGTEEKYGAMVNVLYDIDIARYGLSFYNISPYVGAGVGWVHNRWSNVNVGSGAPGGTLLRINSQVDDIAYQAIAGVAFPIEAVPGLAVTAEYRFYIEPNDRKYESQYFAPGTKLGPNTKVSDDLNHSVMIGVRYAFNAAPPPPPPTPAPVVAPAPAPSRTYLVFFDWDRADLTGRARQIIAEAAQNSTRVQYTRIEVAGHADLTGTPQYNQRLSLRRAQNVAGELVRNGVPQAAISIQAFGDSRPLVPTARGVREPQNRRVEIVLR
ncbi:OmpA family protein [Rhodovastum atsumiense]|uniref:OmpA family protein n=2 Tax=Rhodovastum atsumiense TaxID=504468 RepID=A0A5M6ILI2_9PROT|nr:OmpA family protein [Rhodovastum atsumiense]